MYIRISTAEAVPYDTQTRQELKLIFFAFSSVFSTENVKAVAIVVPIVVAVVLFAIIFAVIKFTKITRSAGPAGTSGANEVPLLPRSHSTEFSLPPGQAVPSSSQTISPNPVVALPLTVLAPPPPSQSLPSDIEGAQPFLIESSVATSSGSPPPTADHSQGITNMAMECGSSQP